MNVKTIVLATIITSGAMGSAQAANLTAANGTGLTQLCITAASGSRAALHNIIMSSGYSKSFIAKNVQCNGSDIVSFIEQHGKNVKAMVHTVDRKSGTVQITDLAMNRVEG